MNLIANVTKVAKQVAVLLLLGLNVDRFAIYQYHTVANLKLKLHFKDSPYSVPEVVQTVLYSYCLQFVIFLIVSIGFCLTDV